MARYNRGMAMRPVNRIKHVVDTSATVAAGAVFAFDFVKTVDAPVLANTTDVETGSKINGVYMKVIIASNEATVGGAIPNVYMLIMKSPATNVATITPNIVGADDSKKFVIHQEMGMIENQISGIPTVLFNGVIKFPRPYIRNGPNDKWKFVILSPAINISFCLQAHFKEFR